MYYARHTPRHVVAPDYYTRVEYHQMILYDKMSLQKGNIVDA